MDVATLSTVESIDRRLFARRSIQYVPASTTVRARKNGVIVFRCLGAGGSGGRGNRQFVNGGNAGTVGIKAVRVTAGDAFTVVIPAGGSIAAGTASTAGADGGTLTITGPGVNISIPGGRGGPVLDYSASAAHTSANADPTGLDWFTLGGRGGSGTSSGNSGTGGGGGAAALLVGGTAHDCAVTATAGAGVGGSSHGNRAGGAGGPGTDTAPGPNLFGEPVQASAPASIESSVLLLDVFGGGGYGSTPAGPGGGAGTGDKAAGFGAGGGGLSVVTHNQVGSPGGRGGGGGGARMGGSSYNCTPGRGGDGWVTVEFFEEEI